MFNRKAWDMEKEINNYLKWHLEKNVEDVKKDKMKEEIRGLPVMRSRF